MRRANDVDPGQARQAAHAILQRHHYDAHKVPRPLQGILDWIGDRLDWVRARFHSTFGHLPRALRPVAWVLVAAAVVVAVLLVARAVRNRLAPSGGDDDDATTATELDADALDAEADRAARAGDYERAVRLRFQAGLVRLDRDAHAIELRPALVNTSVRAELQSDGFDALADTFEGVAYGDRGADRATDDAARTTWPGVVREARR
jgi:hypothetical protein